MNLFVRLPGSAVMHLARIDRLVVGKTACPVIATVPLKGSKRWQVAGRFLRICGMADRPLPDGLATAG
jgi:hypothetical protein